MFIEERLFVCCSYSRQHSGTYSSPYEVSPSPGYELALHVEWTEYQVKGVVLLVTSILLRLLTVSWRRLLWRRKSVVLLPCPAACPSWRSAHNSLMSAHIKNTYYILLHFNKLMHVECQRILNSMKVTTSVIMSALLKIF